MTLLGKFLEQGRMVDGSWLCSTRWLACGVQAGSLSYDSLSF